MCYMSGATILYPRTETHSTPDKIHPFSDSQSLSPHLEHFTHTHTHTHISSDHLSPAFYPKPSTEKFLSIPTSVNSGDTDHTPSDSSAHCFCSLRHSTFNGHSSEESPLFSNP
ncbi:hypothetical protein DIZ76_014378 [Coccidioides immitis]|nr:hypothetical protein DIZ76_014378 [Coccidioides immitis]